MAGTAMTTADIIFCFSEPLRFFETFFFDTTAMFSYPDFLLSKTHTTTLVTPRATIPARAALRHDVLTGVLLASPARKGGEASHASAKKRG